jgi:hypothetical protein
MAAKRSRDPTINAKNVDYAVNFVEMVAWLAGQPDYLNDLREAIRDLDLFRHSRAARTAKLFDWLAAAMSYQGISDAVAHSYMTSHGQPRWREIAAGVGAGKCPLLQTYWHFHGCQYRKSSQTCARPDLMADCPLPRHQFRNGNLNQLAYSLCLFVRDIADGDLVGWLDARLAEADQPGPDRIARMANAIIRPLSGVHGIADKVLNMTLADLLLAASDHNPRWGEVGASLIAIDTLVHNFFARTGILKRLKAEHPYGPNCYGPRGCAAVLAKLSQLIDATQFNSAFPRNFPRYIQRAIWSYCSEDGLAICNGRTIDDTRRCRNWDCRLFIMCDRLRLRPAAKTAISTLIF